MTTPPKALLARFRVYPMRRTLYFQVYVWPTKGAMLWHVNRGCGMALRGRRNFEAICCPSDTINVKSGGRSRMLPLLGQLHFWKGSLRMGIICHESGHAALSYCERMGYDVKEKVTPAGLGVMDVDCGEERFCYALGNIARGIVVGAEKLIYVE